MRKVGMSSCGINGFSIETFEELKKSGIDAVEISITETNSAMKIDWKNMQRLSENTGVELWTAHLPFYPFEVNNIASLDKEVCKKTVETLGEYLKNAANIGIKTGVIHPSGEPIADSDRELSMKHAKESLYELAKICKAEGIVLAIEDLPRTCLGRNSGEVLDLISPDDSLAVCFDTNHLLGESIKDFVKAVGNKIRTLHVSDYDREDERHWLPGEGVIDWVEMMDLLDEIKYDGVFMYEIPPVNNRGHIKRSRKLVASDFYRNACELHNREKLTIVK